MRIHVSKRPGVVLLRAAAPVPTRNGTTHGDVAREVRPGETALGKTYAEWARMPPGPVEVGTAARFRAGPP